MNGFNRCRAAKPGLAAALLLTIATTGRAADLTQQRDAERRALEKREQILQQRLQQEKHTPVQEEATPVPERTPEGGAVRFELKHVDVSASAILSPEEIAGITSRYEGQVVDMAQIQQLVADINALYKEKGFVTAGAFLPKQKIKDGVLHIELVEARLGEMKFEGNRHTRESYLRKRLPFHSGDLVDIHTLEPALVRFNRLNDAQLQVTLEPGEQPGTTNYVVKVGEPPQYRLDLFTDNEGQKQTGEVRGGANVTIASLFGLRDPLSFGGYGTGDLAAAFATYEMPLNSYGTRLSPSFDYNEESFHLSGTGRTPKVVGDTYNGALTLSHPLVVNRSLLLSGFAAGDIRRSSQELANAPQQVFKPTKVDDLSFGFSGDWTDAYGVSAYSQRFTNVFNEEGSNFQKYNGQVLRTQPLRANLWLQARAAGQYASRHRIVTAEAFQLGGALSVRGYPEAYVIGDDGFLGSVQLNYAPPPPPPLPGGVQLNLTPYGFFDEGGVFNETLRTITDPNHIVNGMPQVIGRVNAGSSTYLTSVGLGCVVRWNDYFSSDTSIGFPLNQHPGTDDFRIQFAIHITPPVNGWIEAHT